MKDLIKKFLKNEDGFIGSIISAGASIVGGLLGKSSAKSTNQAQAEQAAETRLFTKEQLQNRHQWEVADLKAAGLNPVLSAGGTPSIGGSAQAQMINPSDSMSKAVQAAASALQLRKMDAEIENIESGTRVNDQIKATQASAEQLNRSTSSVNAAIEAQKRAELPSIAATAKAAEQAAQTEEDIEKSTYGKVMRWLGRLNPFSDNLKPNRSKPAHSGFRK